MAILLIATVY